MKLYKLHIDVKILNFFFKLLLFFFLLFGTYLKAFTANSDLNQDERNNAIDSITNKNKINTSDEDRLNENINIQNDNEDEDEDEDVKNEKKEIVHKTFEEEDIRFRRKLWREISLKTKANKGFFYRDKEIVKFIIKGVRNGSLLPPFKTDKKRERMTKEEFIEGLAFPVNLNANENEEEEWGEEEQVKKETTSIKHEFFERDVSLLEIEEELLFHGRRSEWSFNVLSLKLIIPKEKFETKIRRELGVFDYKELMYYLDSIPEALWRNDMNAALHKKFSIAFKERLFTSILVKVENPDNKNIAEMYGAKSEEEAIEKSFQEEAKLRALMDSVWTP